MSNVFSDLALKMLKKQNITPMKIGQIYYGENNFIMPILLEDGIYHCKFFLHPNYDRINSEVIFSDYLREHNISVPKFLEKEGKKIFEYRENDLYYVFFASEHIEAEKEPVLCKDCIEDIIENISQMHQVSKRINKSLIKLEKVTDYQRLIKLLSSKKKECDEIGLTEYLSRTIEYGTDNSEMYPIHSDLYMGNIMTQNGKFKSFIDFSDIRESYLEDDLGKFFQNLLTAKNREIAELEEFLHIYETRSQIKLSRKNIYISIIYRITYRYFSKITIEKNKDTEYEQKIKEIIAQLIEKLEACSQENNRSVLNKVGKGEL